MFSDFAVSIYFGIGLGGWIYAKISRRTGGNWQESVMMAVGTGLVGALFLFVFLSLVF